MISSITFTACFGIVFGHFAILWLRYEDALGALNPLQARWELTAGRLALLCFAVLIISSEFRKRLRLDYGLWRYLHVAFAVTGFVAATAHIIGVGYYTDAPVKRALWLAVTVFWLGLIIWTRIGKPMVQISHPWRVVENRPEPGDASTLVLEPVGHSGLGAFKPGQFAWLTLGKSPFLLREHPFSIASAPETVPKISFTIKPLGDFTSAIRDINPGERAYLDGPFGVFSVDSVPDAQGFVFIAGGIGITPIMSNLRSMAARNDRRPAVLFYCNPSWDEVVYRDELSDLEGRLDLKIVHVLEEAPDDWDGETGFLDREVLRRHLPPDFTNHHYFLCGPAPMTNAAREALTDLGVAEWRLHSELFELV